jgi:hypothetical protein
MGTHPRWMNAVVAASMAAAWAGAAWAHVPLFPDGPGPFSVTAPTVSKAYYLRAEAGAGHAFDLGPLPRSIPVQLLVLDDERGRASTHRVTVTCADDVRELRAVDTPFYEPFSRLEHRIRVADAVGPSDGPCRIEVTQVDGPPSPYTLSVGDEERFGVGDVIGLLTLEWRLDRWRRGP